MTTLRSLTILSITLLQWLPLASSLWAADGSADGAAGGNNIASFDSLAVKYDQQVRPLIGRYCLDCHSTAKAEGELDLEQFSDLQLVRTNAGVWQKVVEMFESGEMPPDDSPQPGPAEHAELLGWAKAYLDAESRAGAGDPGLVVLRRLSNVEYNNTVRDLTGIDLQPAHEFPVDSAAGEGFTNVGDSLVMSPAMLDKFVGAAKELASHAMLLPTGFRFSRHHTDRDWTDELIAEIRQLYLKYTDPKGSTRVNLQGLVWDTNAGGRIPLESYFNAIVVHRDQLLSGTLSLQQLAADQNLSPRYLKSVWGVVIGGQRSPIIDPIRLGLRQASTDDVAELAEMVRSWQAALTEFKSVGHFKPWQEPIDPVASSREFRRKIEAQPNASEVVIHFFTGDAGDGTEGDRVLWQDARFEAPGREPIFKRDLARVYEALLAKRRTLAEASRYLAAAEALRQVTAEISTADLARDYQCDVDMLAAWLEYLGVRYRQELKIESLFTEKLPTGGGYDFVRGWGSSATPSVMANSSDQQVRIPGIMKPHAVVVHPSPTQAVIVGWRSPIAGEVRITARAEHVHPECGNGLTWSLEHRRAGERRRLGSGEFGGGGKAAVEPVEHFTVEQGDLISWVVGPRGDYGCDLTEVDLTIAVEGVPSRTWNLAKDVSPDMLSGNPHADSWGNTGVWHFYAEPLDGQNALAAPTIPAGSLLDKWLNSGDASERRRLAIALDEFFGRGPEGQAADSPDRQLYDAARSLSGPLLGKLSPGRLVVESATADQFLTLGGETHSERFPSELVVGRELVVTAVLDPLAGNEGSAQVEVFVDQPTPVAQEIGAQEIGSLGMVPGLSVLVIPKSNGSERISQAFAAFRDLFPAALCYPQIVPVDEVVTLALFHREDEALSRLMLSDREREQLEQLWDELWFVSREALKVEVGYVQFMEYVTQDGDVRLFEPLRQPIADRAAQLRQRLTDAEPFQMESLINFARRAYRRPLTEQETVGIRDLYASLRQQDLDHEAAFRSTLARVFLAPSCLYRLEQPADSAEARPVNDWELASRLSYFLWSSMPDETLFELAAVSQLQARDVLLAQSQRMLRDVRARSLATEFGCQWIGVRGFDTHDEKSEQVFPEFADLRDDMYEESVRFFVDLFARDGSVLEILNADYAIVNAQLAQFYGISDWSGTDWQRAERVDRYGRGGVLGMASLLSKQSGASRTSPVLRGNWLLETLLGEKLPKPPKNVPLLPESELDTAGLTVRQLTEKHREHEACAKCHDRIDPFGFALEGFDAIGRRRTTDLAGRPTDTQVVLKDGTHFADIDGLRNYVLDHRREEFLRQFCRKLLGYALGRSVTLSDQLLIDEMVAELEQNDFRFSAALNGILMSRQFMFHRGSDRE